MPDLEGTVEFEHGVEAVEAVGFRCQRHVVPGRELLEIDPGDPGIGEAAGGIAGCFQFPGVLEHLGPGLGDVRDVGLLQRVEVDPHHRRGRVEGERQHLALGGRIVAGDRRQVGVRIEFLAGLLHQLIDRLHRAPGGHHGGGADLEYLHDMRRVAGAERGDAGIHGVGVAALVGRHHLVFALRGVEIVGELDHDLVVAAGHGVPPLDLGDRMGRAGQRQGKRCGHSRAELSNGHRYPPGLIRHVSFRSVRAPASAMPERCEPSSSFRAITAPDDVQMTAQAVRMVMGKRAGRKAQSCWRCGDPFAGCPRAKDA